MKEGILISIIVVLVLIGGYFLFFNEGNSENFQEEIPQNTEEGVIDSLILVCEEKTSFDRLNCFMEIGELTRDVYYCDFLDSKIEEPNSFHEGCILSIARAMNDASICDLDEKGKDNCLNSVEAGSTGTPFECKDAYGENSINANPKYVANCITNLAFAQDNPSFCEQIDGMILSYAIDKSIIMYERDRCFYHLAGNLGDYDLCEEISSEIFRNACLEDYNF